MTVSWRRSASVEALDAGVLPSAAHHRQARQWDLVSGGDAGPPPSQVRADPRSSTSAKPPRPCLCRGTRAYIVGARFAFSLLPVGKPPSASRGVKPLSSVTEQLVATEPGIRVPQGSNPDRYRTNTKPSVGVYRHKVRNHSYSHSHYNRGQSLARPRVVRGQGRDLSRVQLPSRHHDHEIGR